MASDSENADIGWITAMATKLAWVAAANCMAAFADFSERGEPSVGTRIFLNIAALISVCHDSRRKLFRSSDGLHYINAGACKKLT